MRRTTFRKLTKLQLLGSISVFFLAANHQAGLAQQQVEEDERELEEIVVTGSRIARTEYTLTQPILAIGEDILAKRGFDNVAGALNELPSFGLAGNNLISGQGGIKNDITQPVGQQFVNFLGMGSQRTLVVIDGKRVVSQSSLTFENGGQQVDLNIIPTMLVDRIETVTIGGAPTYGSDAIAGTVNIILKDDFEGLELNFESGITDRGDGATQQVSTMWGGNFADDRGNAVVGFQFTDIEAIGPISITRADVFQGARFAQRVGGESQFVPEGATLGLCPADCDQYFFISNGGLPIKTINHGGRTFRNPENFIRDSEGNPLQFAPDGTLVPFDIGIPITTLNSFGGDGPSEFANISARTAQERFNFFGKANYAFSDTVSGFLESFISLQDSTDPVAQPNLNSVFPFARQQVPFRLDNPFLKDSARSIIAANIDFDGDGQPDNTVDTDGDFVPDTPGFYADRWLVDVEDNAPVTSEQDVYIVRAGLDGDFELRGRAFGYDLTYSFGRTEGSARSREIINPFFFNAIDAVRVNAEQAAAINETLRPFGVINVEGGDIVCRNQLQAATEGLTGTPFISEEQVEAQIVRCKPLNLFGHGAPSEEAKAFVTGELILENELQQHDIVGSISGEAFRLPWNDADLSFAAGFELRRDDGSITPGLANQLGVTRETNALVAVDGDIDTNEVFFEGLLPVVTPSMEIPLVQNLEVEGGLRIIDSSITGTDPTWTAGARLRINDDLLVRGNFTHSVRAPSPSELFAPQRRVLFAFTDPCDVNNVDSGPNPEERRQNCRALFDQFVAENPGFDVDPQLPGLQTGFENFRKFAGALTFPRDSNLNLHNEEADAFTIGVVLTPRWAPGLSVAVDWVDIELTDAIFLVDVNTVLSTCFDDPDFTQFCDRILRGPDFQVTNVRETFANIGFRRTQALVTQASYAGSLSDIGLPEWGTFNIGLNYQYLDQLETSILGTGADLNHEAGEFGNPENEVMATLDWFYGDLNVFWRTTWVGDTVVELDEPEGFRVPSQISSSWIHNAAVGYQVSENINLRASVSNVFDRKPTPLEQATVTRSSNEPPTFDILGRRFTLAINARF